MHGQEPDIALAKSNPKSPKITCAAFLPGAIDTPGPGATGQAIVPRADDDGLVMMRHVQMSRRIFQLLRVRRMPSCAH